MVSDKELEMFVDLFRGRGDCYGSWEGGCVREQLTHTVFQNHLGSGPHIGVYPCVVDRNKTMCVWGCSDIDYDNPEHAWLLHDAFEAAGVISWVERTRRGYHIWVFADELVDAKSMRRMFLAAHKVADINPKEVNPKQETLLDGQIGNYVRLPYPNIDGEETRRIISRTMDPLKFSDFVTVAWSKRVTKETIERLAEYYVPQEIHISVAPPTLDMAEAARVLTPLGKTIFRDGPLPGRDRSTTLTHLAHECRKANLAPEDAMILLEDADIRWGKYMMRGEVGKLELQKLLVRAYGPTPST